jgi:hypothetical protein
MSIIDNISGIYGFKFIDHYGKYFRFIKYDETRKHIIKDCIIQKVTMRYIMEGENLEA